MTTEIPELRRQERATLADLSKRWDEMTVTERARRLKQADGFRGEVRLVRKRRRDQ